MMTFNNFCEDVLDKLYDSRFELSEQCTGYRELLKLKESNVKLPSIEEIKRWELTPTINELLSSPDPIYLRFLHPLLRPVVLENWDNILKLK